MDRALRDSLSRWFAVIELPDGDVPPSSLACLGQLAEMLEAVQPSRLDPRRSSIRTTGHGWMEAGAVDVHLVHDTEEHGDVHLVIGRDEAIVAWLAAHEHVFPEDGSAERPWATIVIDVVAAVIGSEYQVEKHYRGNRLTKTRIIDSSDPERPRHLTTTGPLVGWLPWPPQKRVEVQRIDYQLRRPSSGPPANT